MLFVIGKSTDRNFLSSPAAMVISRGTQALMLLLSANRAVAFSRSGPLRLAMPGPLLRAGEAPFATHPPIGDS